MHSQSVLSTVALLGLVAIAPAQLTLPAATPGADGNAAGAIAPFEARAKQQFLVHERLLRRHAGSSVRQLQFRRDSWLGKAFVAGRAHVVLRLASTARSPASLTPDFAQNAQGAHLIEVFRGAVRLPASPALAPNSSPSFSDPRHVVSIDIASFRLTAGSHLLLEVEGEPIGVGTQAWKVDFVARYDNGTVRTIGSGCGPAATEMPDSAYAYGENLVAGGSTSLVAWGRPQTAGAVLIGTSLLPSPLGLSPFGAPGCSLYLTGSVVLPVSHGLDSGFTRYPPAELGITIPSGRTGVGARFFAQAINLEANTKSNMLGVTTTNAVEIRVSNVLPDPDLSTVTSDAVDPQSPFPSSGRVRIGRGPVLRLVFGP